MPKTIILIVRYCTSGGHNPSIINGGVVEKVIEDGVERAPRPGTDLNATYNWFMHHDWKFASRRWINPPNLLRRREETFTLEDLPAR